MFKLNEKVVCIEPIDGLLIKDEIYTVTYISYDLSGILVDNIKPHEPYDYFRTDRFRKIDEDGFADSILNNIVFEEEMLFV